MPSTDIFPLSAFLLSEGGGNFFRGEKIDGCVCVRRKKWTRGWIFSFRDPVLFTFFGCTELKPPFSLAFAHQLKNGRVCCVVVRQLISSDAGGL